jgi:prolipoprotein diacylglyceryltransferase
MLLALGLGKVAQLLGGSGQGLPFDGPWAVAFLGDGPWVSTAAQIPSHPAQLYEGTWLLVGLPVLGGLWRARSELRRPGALFVGALCWFLAGRVLIGFTWRDPGLIGPLNAEQLLALITLAATLGLAFRRIVEPTDSQPRRAAREPTP